MDKIVKFALKSRNKSFAKEKDLDWRLDYGFSFVLKIIPFFF